MIFLAVSGLGSFICLIIVLRKLFAQEGTVKGLLGLFCALYAYAWGWVNLGEQELMDVMFLWTIAMLLGVVANLMAGSPSF
jgi:hypothetical protein